MNKIVRIKSAIYNVSHISSINWNDKEVTFTLRGNKEYGHNIENAEEKLENYGTFLESNLTEFVIKS